MKKLLSSLPRSKKYPVPFLPDNLRVYCVGDIHGRLDLLRQLFHLIERDSAGYNGRVITIFLGDYIDRGKDSKAVLDCLLGKFVKDDEAVFLRGNHEQVLLDFLLMASIGESWFKFGGLDTLLSYGVRVDSNPEDYDQCIEIQQDLIARLPAEHLKFLEKTKISYQIGSYFFVHAGVYPKLPLEKQLPQDMLWIRGEFTDFRKPFEKIIVHGHTVVEQPEVLPNRINIDTGAYKTDKLTALVLENDQQRLLNT